MGLMDFIKKQFINVIELESFGDRQLVSKFQVQDNQIQYGAQLIVRESQFAVFVNEGKLADVFAPGTYTLTTQNMPVLTNLKNWDKLFESPFKTDVYFVNAKTFIANGWGTSQPVTVRDAELDLVRVRSFGKYTFKVENPSNFLFNISGLVENYEIDALEPQLKNIIVSNFSDFLGNSKIPFIDMASNQLQLSKLIQEKLVGEFSKLGLSLVDFLIENLSVPEEVQRVMDQKSSMRVIGNLDSYMKFQVADSVKDLAQNEGAGIAAMGAGFGLGNVLAQNMAGGASVGAPESLESRLKQAKSLLDAGLITQADFDKVKNDILSKL